MNFPNSKNEGSTDSTSMAFVSRPYNSSLTITYDSCVSGSSTTTGGVPDPAHCQLLFGCYLHGNLLNKILAGWARFLNQEGDDFLESPDEEVLGITGPMVDCSTLSDFSCR